MKRSSISKPAALVGPAKLLLLLAIGGLGALGCTPVPYSTELPSYRDKFTSDLKVPDWTELKVPDSIYDTDGNGRTTCKELRSYGIKGPFRVGSPNYRRQRDRDSDGLACE